MTTPQLTPAKLFYGKTLPAKWKEPLAAFICFTPFPTGFEKYVIDTTQDRSCRNKALKLVKIFYS